MSEILRVSYVVEGPTDFIVLDSLIERFLGTRDYVPTRIQPPTSAYANDQGPLGGGWRGVLKWCADIGGSTGGLAGNTALLNCDCLVIHVDADVATESDVAEGSLAAPCPPARDACDNIRDHLVTLLGSSVPARVVLCVPAQCTEAWIVAALHYDLADRFEPLECRPEPERLLIGKPDKLIRDKGGRSQKQKEQYNNTAAKIAAGWPNAVARCAEARRFDEECRAALG